MAGEFNIVPAHTFNEFDDNIVSVMKEMTGMLPKGYKLSVVPHMVFPQDVMDKASQKALELGCSPDYNAWTGGVNPPPDASQNPLMRCAGGHLHVGWTEGESLGSIQQDRKSTRLNFSH